MRASPGSSVTTLVDDESISTLTKARTTIFEIEAICDWIVKTTGLVAAILFGIWAPISYNATKQGNASNDEAQNFLLEELKTMTRIQISLIAEIKSMNEKMIQINAEVKNTNELLADALSSKVEQPSSDDDQEAHPNEQRSQKLETFPNNRTVDVADTNEEPTMSEMVTLAPATALLTDVPSGTVSEIRTSILGGYSSLSTGKDAIVQTRDLLSSIPNKLSMDLGQKTASMFDGTPTTTSWEGNDSLRISERYSKIMTFSYHNSTSYVHPFGCEKIRKMNVDIESQIGIGMILASSYFLAMYLSSRHLRQKRKGKMEGMEREERDYTVAGK